MSLLAKSVHRAGVAILLSAVLCVFSARPSLAQTTVWAWGDNEDGQLGNGTYTTTPPYGLSTPAEMNAFSGVTAIAGGYTYSLALKSDGTVWAWGNGPFGQISGDGTPSKTSTPVQVIGLSSVTAIAAGYGHCLALKSDGTVWAWGYNGYGQVGNGTLSNISPLVQVMGLGGVTAIAARGYHSMALKSDGTVWAWGLDASGQLGNGTTIDLWFSTPVQVVGLSGVTAIASGSLHSLALKSDGTVWAWGNNGLGQLGNGTITTSYYLFDTPAQVVGLSGVTAIAGGSLHSLALKTDGAVWAWGGNSHGQLGNGMFSDSGTPVQVIGLSSVRAIAAGWDHSLALKTDGTLQAWGWNFSGQLGNGTFTRDPPYGISLPAPVIGLSGVMAISGANVHSLALVDATSPGITPHVTGTLGSNGWYRSNVTVNWNVTDPESGIESSSGCGTTTLTADTPGTTLTCSATNGAGLSASVPVTIKIDKTLTGTTDVSGKLQIAVSGFALNRITNTFSGTVTFRNITPNTIQGPFYFIPANLGPGLVLLNKTGVWVDNNPYLLVDGLTTLAPGATGSVRVQFNRTTGAIRFDPKFYAGSQ